MISLWTRRQSATVCSSATSTKRTSSMCGSLHSVTAHRPTPRPSSSTSRPSDQVATITLDSPHNRNALSRQLVTELFERLESAEADDAVKVVLVRSCGRVFCSGADLTEAATARAWSRAPGRSCGCSG